MQSDFGPLPEHKNESTRFKEFWRRDYYCLHIHVRSSSERNHLLPQMIWRNNFSEKKSFFFRFNQNCKILISCPFFTISDGQTDFTFYTQKRIFLENWLTCIRICPVGNKMHVLSRQTEVWPWKTKQHFAYRVDNCHFCLMNSSFVFASTVNACKTVNFALSVANSMIQSWTSIKT